MHSFLLRTGTLMPLTLIASILHLQGLSKGETKPRLSVCPHIYLNQRAMDNGDEQTERGMSKLPQQESPLLAPSIAQSQSSRTHARQTEAVGRDTQGHHHHHQTNSTKIRDHSLSSPFPRSLPLSLLLPPPWTLLAKSVQNATR